MPLTKTRLYPTKHFLRKIDGKPRELTIQRLVYETQILTWGTLYAWRKTRLYLILFSTWPQWQIPWTNYTTIKLGKTCDIKLGKTCEELHIPHAKIDATRQNISSLDIDGKIPWTRYTTINSGNTNLALEELHIYLSQNSTLAKKSISRENPAN